MVGDSTTNFLRDRLSGLTQQSLMHILILPFPLWADTIIDSLSKRPSLTRIYGDSYHSLSWKRYITGLWVARFVVYPEKCCKATGFCED